MVALHELTVHGVQLSVSGDPFVYGRVLMQCLAVCCCCCELFGQCGLLATCHGMRHYDGVNLTAA